MLLRVRRFEEKLGLSVVVTIGVADRSWPQQAVRGLRQGRGLPAILARVPLAFQIEVVLPRSLPSPE
ncbi:hypothetical protein ACFLS5_03015 [Candidatus Bipolaricaulota bacterium]